MFDIQATPPNTRAINKRRCAATAVLVGGGFLFPFVFLLVFALPDPSREGFAVLLMLALLVAFVAIFGGTSMAITCSDVSDTDCAALLKVCNATGEGRVYRKAVLEQGRKFVNGELAALTEWSANAAVRENCKRLYDIPTDTVTAPSPISQ
jgi:hypothetical protein